MNLKKTCELFFNRKVKKLMRESGGLPVKTAISKDSLFVFFSFIKIFLFG